MDSATFFFMDTDYSSPTGTDHYSPPGPDSPIHRQQQHSSSCLSGADYQTVSSAPPKRRAGRTKFRETRHPVFKGVRRRNADKWVCEVREPNKKSRIWLGTFPTAEMAARAHDVAALALRGKSACLNFADSPWMLPTPKSTSPRDIQRAAAEAAEAFRPVGVPPMRGAGPGSAGDDDQEEDHQQQIIGDATAATASSGQFGLHDAAAVSAPAASCQFNAHYHDSYPDTNNTPVGLLSPPHWPLQEWSWSGSDTGSAFCCSWDDDDAADTSNGVTGDFGLWSYSL